MGTDADLPIRPQDPIDGAHPSFTGFANLFGRDWGVAAAAPITNPDFAPGVHRCELDPLLCEAVKDLGEAGLDPAGDDADLIETVADFLAWELAQPEITWIELGDDEIPLEWLPPPEIVLEEVRPGRTGGDDTRTGNRDDDDATDQHVPFEWPIWVPDENEQPSPDDTTTPWGDQIPTEQSGDDDMPLPWFELLDFGIDVLQDVFIEDAMTPSTAPGTALTTQVGPAVGGQMVPASATPLAVVRACAKRAGKKQPTKNQIIRMARECGLQTAAATYGCHVTAICEVVAQGPTRRRRGISSADLSRTNSTLRKINTIQKNVKKATTGRRC